MLMGWFLQVNFDAEFVVFYFYGHCHDAVPLIILFCLWDLPSVHAMPAYQNTPTKMISRLPLL
jgi:hypothetical protein